LSEGLGSALLNMPGLEPALLLAHRLCSSGLPAMNRMSVRGACPLNSSSQTLAAARRGEASAWLLREPALPTFPVWRATTASRSALQLLDWFIDLVLSPRQPERRFFMPSGSTTTGLRRLAVSKTASMNHTASTALPNVRHKPAPAAKRLGRAAVQATVHCSAAQALCCWGSA